MFLIQLELLLASGQNVAEALPYEGVLLHLGSSYKKGKWVAIVLLKWQRSFGVCAGGLGNAVLMGVGPFLAVSMMVSWKNCSRT